MTLWNENTPLARNISVRTPDREQTFAKELLAQERQDIFSMTKYLFAAVGKVFRRYWIPACLVEETPEPKGPPVVFNCPVRTMSRSLAQARSRQ